jgi:multidrug efflux pump subunit AcrA (membrane-fusion protein)
MNATMRNKLLSTVLVLAAAGCTIGQGEPTATPAPDEDFVPVISATGQVVPVEWGSLSLPTGGVVAALPVKEGDAVAKDQLLLRLSGREQLEAALAAAELEEVAAQQALDQVREEEALARALAQDALANAREDLRKAEYTGLSAREPRRDTIDRARRS